MQYPMFRTVCSSGTSKGLSIFARSLLVLPGSTEVSPEIQSRDADKAIDELQMRSSSGLWFSAL